MDSGLFFVHHLWDITICQNYTKHVLILTLLSFGIPKKKQHNFWIRKKNTSVIQFYSITVFFRNEDNVRHPAFSVLQKLNHYSCSIFLSILLYSFPPKSFQREVFVFQFQRLFTYSESLLSWEWTKDLLGAL